LALLISTIRLLGMEGAGTERRNQASRVGGD